jgi:hypothetical protein
MRVLDDDPAAVRGFSGGLPMTTLTCTRCGAAFEGKEHRRNKPYCSNLCRFARDKQGEKHHGAKLTEAQVRAIRADPRRHRGPARRNSALSGGANLTQSNWVYRHAYDYCKRLEGILHRPASSSLPLRLCPPSPRPPAERFFGAHRRIPRGLILDLGVEFDANHA